jgi:hypothetical protein
MPSTPSRTRTGATIQDRLAKHRLPGLRPYNQYKLAELKTRKVDVKLAPGCASAT